MMERVLGPLPKHMIVRAEYVYKSFVIFLIYFFDIFCCCMYIQDEVAGQFCLGFCSY
jgi:hypothetical protein